MLMAYLAVALQLAKKTQSLPRSTRPNHRKRYKATCTAQGKEVKRANEPCKINDSGEYEIYAKQAAKIKVSPTADNPDGVVEFKIALFDANVKPITDEPKIGSGTKLRMSVTPYTWYVPSQGFGYTLRLKAVQIIELLEYQSTGFTALKDTPQQEKHSVKC